MRIFGFNAGADQGELRGADQLQQHRRDDGARCHRLDGGDQPRRQPQQDRNAQGNGQGVLPAAAGGRAGRHAHPLRIRALLDQRQCRRAAARTSGWSTTGTTSRASLPDHDQLRSSASLRYSSTSYVSGTITTAPHSTYAGELSARPKGTTAPRCRPTASRRSTTSSSKTRGRTAANARYQDNRPPTSARSNGRRIGVSLTTRPAWSARPPTPNYDDTYDKITEPALGTDSQWQLPPVRLRRLELARRRQRLHRGARHLRDRRLRQRRPDQGARSRYRPACPVAGKPARSGGRCIPSLIYARALEWNGSGSFTSQRRHHRQGIRHSARRSARPPARLRR